MTALDDVPRKLAAILALDAVGYSRLMGKDEESTVERLKACRRELIDPTIATHRGRIVKTMGDGFLAEFASVVDAVRCAVNIHAGMAERNAAVAPDQRIEFRCGINIGDIIVDGDDIFGDGVNIAARLEGLAKPGGICISHTVRDQLQNKLDLLFEDIGEQTLKNISRPIRVYRIVGASAAGPAVAERISLVLPSKPSLAVLPFQNLSDDPSKDYFVDGIVDDQITALARIKWFFVISRNSSFIYKGRTVDPREVAREFGVRYVLEGSMRAAGNRIRVSCQLIDAPSQHQVWANRYDRQLDDIFAIQDDITRSIVAAVEPELSAIEEQRAYAQNSTDLAAYDCVQRGYWHIYRFTQADFEAAQKSFEQAIAIDPHYASGYAGAALNLYYGTHYGWIGDRNAGFNESRQFSQRTLELDEEDPRGHLYFGQSSLWLRRHEEAMPAIERSLELNPSFANAYSVLGYGRDFVGRFDEAITALDQSERLRPNDRMLWRCLPAKAMAQYQLRNYSEAAQVAYRATSLGGNFWLGYQILAASLGQLDRHDEAEDVVRRLRTMTGASLGHLLERLPFRNPDHVARIADGLNKAGWNE